MAVNYEDERFAQVEEEKNAAVNEIDQTYGEMIDQSDKFYDAQIDATKQWADTQGKLQQEQTDFAIEQVEQQKQQAQKDYAKEQSGAYVDYKKQSNQYGVQAEQMASAGLSGTGFSESSQVSMYNTYQNRVATAREVVSRAMLNYENAIKDARLQNNAALAEIAFNALQQELALGMQGFQYKNQLLLDQASKKLEVDNMYYNRWQNVLAQINHENAFAEEVRQYNQNYELQQKQFQEQIRQYNQEYELQRKQFDEQIRQFEVEIARLKENDEKTYRLQIQQLEMDKAKVEEAKRQWEEEMKLKREQFDEDKRQFNEQMALKTGGSSSNPGNEYVLDSDEPTQPSSETTDNRGDLGIGKIDDEQIAKMIYSGIITATYDSTKNRVTYKWTPGGKKTYDLMNAKEKP